MRDATKAVGCCGAAASFTWIVSYNGCKCVGSGTWHVQPESFACAGHVRIARYCACLRFGVQGAGVGSVDGLDLERSSTSVISIPLCN